MKKTISLLLALCMLAVICAGCGSNTTSSGSEASYTAASSAASNTTASSDTASSDAAPSDAASTNADGNTLIMATNAFFEPYEYYDANNEIVGIDAEVGKAIADKLGLALRSPTWSSIPSSPPLKVARPTLAWPA